MHFSSRIQKDRLAAELSSLDELVRSAPDDDVFTKASLLEQREELLSRLASLPDGGAGAGASAALLFSGTPVLGTRGIESAFATEVVSDFDNVVRFAWGIQKHGNLAKVGPIKGQKDAKTYIVATPRGSFGFELQTLADESLDVAMQATTRAIFAAKGGEEDLDAAAELLGERSFVALGKFFETIKRAHAKMRLVTAQREESFNTSDVELAALRTAQTKWESQEDVPLSGTFLGVLPHSKTFDFQVADGETISGRVSETFSETALRAINAKWSNQPCVAHVNVTTLRRNERRTTRYILLSEPAAAADETREK